MPVRLAQQRLDVGAVGAVHRDAAAAGDEADDRVARHRGAAAGELDPDVVGAHDHDARVAAARRRSARVGRGGLGEVLARRPPRRRASATRRPHDVLRRTRGPRRPRRTARRCRRSAARWPGRSATRASSAAAAAGPACASPWRWRPCRCSIASSRRSLENHWRILLRARGLLTKVSQSRRRPGAVGLGGEDLDDVAVLERALQRHEPAVDPAADAVVPDLGVHRVGEVDRGGRRPAGRSTVALGREDVDLAGVDLEPQRVEELARVGGLALPVEQLAQPGHVVDRPLAAGRARRRLPSVAPCTSSARRRRTRPGGASCGCGSGSRPACPRARSPWCAATGTC